MSGLNMTRSRTRALQVGSEGPSQSKQASKQRNEEKEAGAKNSTSPKTRTAVSPAGPGASFESKTSIQASIMVGNGMGNQAAPSKRVIVKIKKGGVSSVNKSGISHDPRGLPSQNADPMRAIAGAIDQYNQIEGSTMGSQNQEFSPNLAVPSGVSPPQNQISSISTFQENTSMEALLQAALQDAPKNLNDNAHQASEQKSQNGGTASADAFFSTTNDAQEVKKASKDSSKYVQRVREEATQPERSGRSDSTASLGRNLPQTREDRPARWKLTLPPQFQLAVTAPTRRHIFSVKV